MDHSEALDQLYRATVLGHSAHPHNFGHLPSADREATGHNPLCGDKITLYLRLESDGRINAAGFEATGCAISMASASMMTDAVRGMQPAEARDLVRQIYGMYESPPGPAPPGDMAALTGVREFPSRIRCATLPWRTLLAALQRSSMVVSTEQGR